LAKPHIKDILIEFKGDELTKYGLFPLVIWYLMDVIGLPEYFQSLTVKSKRNSSKSKHSENRKPKFNEVQMSMGLIVIMLLGIPRLRKINDVLSTETKLAELIGLPEFFDQSTAHNFLREFGKWHLDQLEKINDQLIQEFGFSSQQDILILDLDSQTISQESRKREQCVRGYNKKKPGKPCYQWNVAFAKGEAVTQVLRAGNTHGSTCFKEIVKGTKQKLDKPISIVRVDGAYLSGSMIEFIFSEGLQVITTEKYNWIIAQENVHINPQLWENYDEDTRIYDLGYGRVLSTTDQQLRAILVEKQQYPFPGKKKMPKILRYAIVENLTVRLAPFVLYEFYHQRQTIENFFKESGNSFNSGKMPSQKFKANQAYLLYLAIAYNCFVWFKKNFCHQNGKILPFNFSENE
jgi:hypothetical protein